ncbi:MAG: acyl-CoA thioesterase [Phycisphaeraceae bacterium]
MSDGHEQPLLEPASLRTDTGETLVLDVTDAFLYSLVAEASDMDGQGHVNNAVYVRWMDRAAYAHSQAVGYDVARYRQLGTSFVVRRHEIDYYSPAYAGDPIVVATWPCAMEKFTALRRHQIIRPSDGRTLARALTTWIYLDVRRNRPHRIPAEMIAAFRPRG